MAKSLLNNLLGRFGLKLERYLTKLVDGEVYNNILQQNKIIDVKFIGENF